jgi:hypothetical protein
MRAQSKGAESLIDVELSKKINKKMTEEDTLNVKYVSFLSTAVAENTSQADKYLESDVRIVRRKSCQD